MVKRLVLVVLSVIFFIACLSVFDYSPNNAFAAGSESEILKDYLLSRVGESFSKGKCQAFVYQALKNTFDVDNTGTACCATKAWQLYGVSSARDNIPLGAAVYFAGSSVVDSICGQQAGHVGLYIGDNYIVHVWSAKIQKTTIDYVVGCGYTYRGWGWQGGRALSQPNANTGPSTLAIYPVNPPSGSLPIGQSYPLKGTVSSNYLISLVKGSIINADGGTYCSVSISPNAYNVDIRSSNINSQIVFGNIPAGKYKLEYYAKDSSGATKTWTGDWFWIGPIGDHTHNKGTYLFYEAAHPHCNCYKCSICGETWRDTSSSNEMSNCYYCQKPGKPALKNFAKNYASANIISFNWDAVSKATHYNLYIDKQSSEGWQSNYKIWHYAESGMTTTLEDGTYRVLLQATNKNCAGEDGTGWAYTNGDYITFSVGTNPEIIGRYRNYDGYNYFFQGWFFSSVFGSKYFKTLDIIPLFNSGGSPLTKVSVSLQMLDTSLLFLPVYQTIQDIPIDLQGVTSYDFQNSNEKLNLKNLDVGTYRIVYQATNTYGTTTKYQNFKVLPAPDPMPSMSSDPQKIEIDNVFNWTCQLHIYKIDDSDSNYIECMPGWTVLNGLNITRKQFHNRNHSEASITYYSSGDHSAAVYAYIHGGNDTETDTPILIDYIRIPYDKHTYNSETIVPSCTSEGCTKYTCQFCGKVVKQDIVNALGHSWDKGKITKKPTETTDGVKTYTCTRCGKTKTEKIPALNSFRFDDVKDPKAYYFDAVYWAYNHTPYQVTAGIDATHFGPNQTVTRAQAMTFFWAAKDRPKFKKANTQFVDVKKTDWYYKSVMWAVENGITAGTDATHFSPNKTCNRGEILAFLYAAMKKPKVKIKNPYKDVTNQWYKKAALWAYEQKIEKGEKGKFNASTPCTRASTVTYLYRFLERKSLLD